MCGEIFSTVSYKAAGIVKLLICKGSVEAGDNDIRRLGASFYYIYALCLEIFNKLVCTDKIYRLAGSAAVQEHGGNVA